MASVPLLMLPGLCAAALINILDWRLPQGCYVYAGSLIVCLIGEIGGGLFVGPMLDF